MFERFFAIRTARDDIALRGRLLKGACLMVAIGVLADLPVALDTEIEQGYQWVKWALLVMVVLCAGIFALADRGRVTLGGLLLSTIGMIFLSVTSTPQTILSGPIGVGYIIPILIAGLVVGDQGIILFWLLSLAMLAILQTWFNGEITSVYISAIILSVSSLLAWLIIRSMRRLLRYAQSQAAAAEHAEAEVTEQKHSLQASNEELREANSEMERLISVVRDLETPAIPVIEGVLIVPLVGYFDSRRAKAITSTLLSAVHDQRARVVIIDITGLAMIDMAVAGQLIQLAQAIKLLGAQVMLTGITATAAQSLAALNIPLGEIQTAGRLQDGVAAVLGIAAGTAVAAGAR